MQRRTFIKYSMASSATIIFPQTISAVDWKDIKKTGDKLVKTAIYCSKLTPVRFFSGLLFNGVKEVYLTPMAEKMYADFLGGRKFSENILSSYDGKSLALTAQTISHMPYKASIAVFGESRDVTYNFNTPHNEVALELQATIDNKRFEDIRRYLKDREVSLQLYGSETPLKVTDRLTANQLFNVNYIVSPSKKDYINLLEIAENSEFKKLIV